MPRYVADDFGLCPSVDRAILELARTGGLDGASVLVTHADPATVAELAEVPGFEVGLHLNLTEGHSVSAPVDAASLVHPDGRFRDVFDHVWRFGTRQLGAAAVVTEIAAQWDALEAMAGRVDYVDGHQHVHYVPPILDALARVVLSRRRSTPRLRLGRFVESSFGLRSFGLGTLAMRNRRAHPALAERAAPRVVDFGCIAPGDLNAEDEVMLHVAHPEVPDDTLGGTYPWAARVSQFESRRTEAAT